jgi:Ca2+-binding EF-hand superfamily protein
MRRAFRIFDEDGNGFVDITELVHVVCHLGGTEADAECMLEAMDANHDGLITFEDFCTASAPLYNGGQAALRRAFDLIDDDHKGFLDVKKLEVLLKRLGMHCSRGTVHLPPSRATHDDDNAAATANDDEGKASSLKEDPGIYDQSELLSDVFASADMNHDGRVSFPEFLALFNKPKALSGDLVKSFSSQAGKGSGVPSAE